MHSTRLVLGHRQRPRGRWPVPRHPDATLLLSGALAMKRGDVVTVAAGGDYGKPRPAVIVQTDALPAEHASVVVCQMTSECSDAPDFRVTVEPTEKNGLRVTSQVMADKPVTIRRERIGRDVRPPNHHHITHLNIPLTVPMPY